MGRERVHSISREALIECVLKGEFWNWDIMDETVVFRVTSVEWGENSVNAKITRIDYGVKWNLRLKILRFWEEYEYVEIDDYEISVPSQNIEIDLNSIAILTSRDQNQLLDAITHWKKML